MNTILDYIKELLKDSPAGGGLILVLLILAILALVALQFLPFLILILFAAIAYFQVRK